MRPNLSTQASPGWGSIEEEEEASLLLNLDKPTFGI
jgi:hypothetical protein